MGEPEITNAASLGYFEKVKTLLNEGADINAVDDSNYTALRWAVDKQDIRMTEFLIMRGADINIRSIFGNSPLMIAAELANDCIATLLINHRAVINVQHTIDGNTALHLAASTGNRKTIEALLKAKADVKVRNKKGELPIDKVDLRIKASIQHLFEDARLEFEIEDPKTTLTSKNSSL